MKFDVLIVNPPYQGKIKPNKNKNRRGTGSVFYYKYIVGIIHNIAADGYLLSVHPRGWRRPDNIIFNRIKQGTLHFLKIYNVKKCKHLFSGNIDVAVDYIFWQNKNNHNQQVTTIHDARNVISRIYINDWPLLPNYNYSLFDRILVKNNNEKSLQTVKLENRRDYSLEPDSINNIPCIHSINKYGTRYAYISPLVAEKWRLQSETLKYPLVLVSHSQGSTGFRNVIILNDYQHFSHQMIGLYVNNNDEALALKEALETDFFKHEILHAILCGNFMVPHKSFKFIKANIWELVNEYR